MKKASSVTDELAVRSVTIFVQSKLFTLQGDWQWDLLSDAVYCSDVMFNLPQDFIGTKGIVHPEDIPEIRRSIYFREAIGEEDTSDIKFRIITTYGDVRTLTGKKIRFIKKEDDPYAKDPIEVMLKKVAGEMESNKEDRLHTFKRDIAEFSEKITQTGSWFFNLSTGEIYYSDNYFRLFGLPPQSLNAQLYTFANFLHPEDNNAVIGAIDKSCSEQVPLDIQYRIIRADGQLRYLQHTSKVNFNTRGENVVYGIIRDISEQKLQAIELEQNDVKLDLQNRILEFTDTAINIGHWHVDLLTRKFSFSDQYYKIIGLRGPNIVPSLTTISQYVHPDDQQTFSETHRKMISQQAVPDAEFRIIRPDGKARYVHIKGKMVIVGKTDMVVIGTIKDVTNEKIAERRLNELKNEVLVKDLVYSRAEQMAKMAGWVVDVAGDKTTWSTNLFSILGVKITPDFTINSLLKFVHPLDRTSFSQHLHEAALNNAASEFQFRLLTRGENRQFKAIFKAAFEETSKFVICIIQDITSHYSLQQKLTEKLYFTELLSDSVQEKVLVIDLNYSIIEWNKPCETAFGKKKIDVLYNNFFDVFPELKNSDIIKDFREVMAGETVSSNTRFNTYLKGQHSITFSPLKDVNDNIIGIMQVFVDITKEAELQTSLNQRLNFIENLVEASIDPLIVLDRHLNYLYWNHQSELLFKLNKEFIIGKNILEILPVTANNPSNAHFRQALKGNTIYLPAAENDEGQYHEVYLVPIKDEKNIVTGILWMLHDLTKEMQLVQQLKESQHLLQQTANATPDALTIFDLEKKEPIYLNNVLPEWVGYTNEELNQMGFVGRLQLIHEDDQERLLSHNASMRVAEDSEVKSIEYRLLSKDGTITRVCNRTKVFSRDKKGRVKNILSVLQKLPDQP